MWSSPNSSSSSSIANWLMLTMQLNKTIILPSRSKHSVRLGIRITIQIKHLSWVPVWLDFAKFRHFGKKIKALGNFYKPWVVSWNFFNLLWQKCYALGQFYIVVNDQKLKNDKTIWSHWSWRFWENRLTLASLTHGLDT